MNTDELRKLAEAATPGPWGAYNMVNTDGESMTPKEIGEMVERNVIKSKECGGFDHFLFVAQAHGEDVPDLCHVGNGPNGPANAAFIAAASPDVVIGLLDRVAELEAERDKWWEACKAADSLAIRLERKLVVAVEELIAQGDDND